MTTPAEDGMDCRRSTGSKIQLLVAIGMIFTLLLLNVAVIADDNFTDMNVTDPTPEPEVTTVLTTEPLDVITTLLTPVPAESDPIPTTSPDETSVLTTLVPQTTFITTVPTNEVFSYPTKALQAPRQSSGIEEYNIRQNKRVTQEEKEAAAANYKTIREAFLMRGTLDTPIDTLDGAPPIN